MTAPALPDLRGRPRSAWGDLARTDQGSDHFSI